MQKVQCVLESGKCNPNVLNKHGHTPLHVVCRGENIEVVEMLVTDQRCDANIPDNNKNAPLQTVIYTQSRMQMLLDCKKCDPNQQNADGNTALHIVSRMILSFETKFQYLQLLLSTPGIYPEVLNKGCLAPFDVTDKDGNTLLHNACAEGESKMVQLLIENGADVLRPDRHRNAPIHKACMDYRLDILIILLSCKHGNSNQQNEDGDTALHIVCKMRISNELEYLNLLLSALRVDIQQSDRNENASIHIACQYSTINTLKTCEPTNRMLMEIQHFIL